MPSGRIGCAIEQITAAPDPARVAQIASLAGDAADAAETGRAPLDPIMDALEALTGFREDRHYWASFHGGDGPEQFARIIAAPLPGAITDLSPDEIGALLALEETYRLDDQAIYQRVLQYLSACLGAAFTTDLIYWPHRVMSAQDLRDEVVLRRAILRDCGPAGLAAHERGHAQGVMADPDAPRWAQHWARGVLARD